MREIRFRGKRIDNGEWVEGSFCQNPTTKTCFIVTCTAFEVDPSTVGQYTGLTDKNGERIFEGDILKLERDIYHGEKTIKRETHIGRVWYDEKRAEFGIESKGYCRCLTLKRWDGDFQEIIGNIHDNPELLEVHHE